MGWQPEKLKGLGKIFEERRDNKGYGGEKCGYFDWDQSATQATHSVQEIYRDFGGNGSSTFTEQILCRDDYSCS